MSGNEACRGEDLSRYIAEVKALCQSCQRLMDTKLIKYAVYYTDEGSWNAFATVQDMLDDPKAWEEFKTAICVMYPICKAAHIPSAMPQNWGASSLVQMGIYIVVADGYCGTVGGRQQSSINLGPAHMANVWQKQGGCGMRWNVQDEHGGGAGNGLAAGWQVQRGDRAAVRWLGNGRMALASCERYGLLQEVQQRHKKSDWRGDQRAPHGGLQL